MGCFKCEEYLNLEIEAYFECKKRKINCFNLIFVSRVNTLKPNKKVMIKRQIKLFNEEIVFVYFIFYLIKWYKKGVFMYSTLHRLYTKNLYKRQLKCKEKKIMSYGLNRI